MSIDSLIARPGAQRRARHSAHGAGLAVSFLMMAGTASLAHAHGNEARYVDILGWKKDRITRVHIITKITSGQAIF